MISNEQNDLNKTSILKIPENKLSLLEKMYFNFAQNMSMKIFRDYCDGEVKGYENIENLKRGFVLASNHVSYLDWLVLFSLFKNRFNREITFLAKEKLFKSIVWNKLIKASNCIEVTDMGIGINSMRRIYKTISNNGIIGVFPEGTRSNNGELLKAKEGMAKIAALTGAPIVPVGLVGFYDTWPRHKLLPAGFKKCKIIIGRPLYINAQDNDDYKEREFDNITITVMNRIAFMIGKKYAHNKTDI